MATEIARGPRMAREMSMIDFQTRIGDEILSPAFVKHLERFYDKANIDDKAKCLELITSLKLGKAIEKQALRRPHTAMATVGREDGAPVLSPYQTTYKREYVPKPDPNTRAVRPKSTQAYAASHDLHGPVGTTTYFTEYGSKSLKKESAIRSGSASGDRNNNPHPSKAFLVWRFPSKPRKTMTSNPYSEALTDEKINQVHKRLCQSTYQSDYLGIPQGFQVKTAYNLPPDWKEDIPYTLDSVQRNSYQAPNQQTELQLPTSRYGCNKKKTFAAYGAIPSATSERQLFIKGRTTYDRHYNDNATAVVKQIRDVGRKLGAETLKKYYEKATGEDKDSIGQLLDAYQVQMTPKPPRTPSSQANVHIRFKSPAATPISDCYSKLAYSPVQPPIKQDTPISVVPYSPPTYLG